jgi:phosphatidate cytidylyltransferase
MKRILTALVLIPFAVWIILKGPYPIFLALLAVFGLLAFYEFDNISEAQGIPRAGVPGMLAGLVLLLVPEPLLIVVFTVILAMCVALSGELKDALPRTGALLVGVVYIFGAWRCAVELRAINPHWLMIAALVSWAGDTFALYIGKAFGKHKLAPVVSPSKTWEGSAGSVGGGIIAAVVYAHFLIPSANAWAVAVTGAIANIAGQLGDLCESAFKRGAGVKDSGSGLPGHGGFLDRIDSTLFSVPATYALLRILLQYF